MNTKKSLLLASMALALVAFAVPANASALTLKDAGKEVSDKTAQLSGELDFDSLAGGIDCFVHVTITINGQAVHLSSLNITTPTCKGTDGLKGCQVTADSVTGLPWGIDVDATVLTVTGVHIHYTLSPLPKETCSPKTFTVNFASVTAIPDNTSAIHSVTIQGEGGALIEGVEFEAEASGVLSFVGSDVGTYAIG